MMCDVEPLGQEGGAVVTESAPALLDMKAFDPLLELAREL